MLAEDENCEFSLRPRFLAEYIGQGNVKEHIGVYIHAAKLRGGGVGSHPALRPAGSWKNDACGNNRKRDGRQSAHHERAPQ